MIARFLGYTKVYGHKYILWVIWCVCTGAVFWRTFLRYKYDLEYYYLYQLLGDSLCTARSSANVVCFNCAIVLLPMCHTLAVKISQALRKFNICGTWIRLNTLSIHVWAGYTILIMSAMHTGSHMVNIWKYHKSGHRTRFSGVHPFPNEEKVSIKIVFTTVTGVTGLLLTGVIAAMFVTSLPFIRKRFYNVFWVTHRLFVLFYALLFIHGLHGPLRKQVNVDRHVPGCTFLSIEEHGNETHVTDAHIRPNTTWQKCQEEAKFTYHDMQAWMWLSGPVAIYACDVLFRYIRRSKPVDLTSAVMVSDAVIELTFQTNQLKAKPGQYVLLNCPTLSTIQWHPFTIAKVPLKTNGNTLKLVINTVGDWTDGLVRTFRYPPTKPEDTGAQPGDNTMQIPDVLSTRSRPSTIFHVDGPFTSPMEKLQNYSVVLCIAGGSGITPFLSFISYIRDKVKKRKTNFVYLVYTTRDEGLVNYTRNKFDDTIKEALRYQGVSLQTHFHYTGEKQRAIESGVSCGRPNLTSIFSEIKNAHIGTSVGTFVCGPPGLCQNVKKHCIQNSTITMSFVLHKETF